MGGKLGAGKGPMADINVTPLIDVVLVLLVVFMVITPMVQASQPVTLPQSTQSAMAKGDGVHVTITMSAEKGLFVGADEATIDSLIDLVQADISANPHRTPLLKADREITYGEVRTVLDLLAEHNMTSVFVAVTKE